MEFGLDCRLDICSQHHRKIELQYGYNTYQLDMQCC